MKVFVHFTLTFIAIFCLIFGVGNLREDYSDWESAHRAFRNGDLDGFAKQLGWILGRDFRSLTRMHWRRDSSGQWYTVPSYGVNFYGLTFEGEVHDVYFTYHRTFFGNRYVWVVFFGLLLLLITLPRYFAHRAVAKVAFILFIIVCVPLTAVALKGLVEQHAQEQRLREGFEFDMQGQTIKSSAVIRDWVEKRIYTLPLTPWSNKYIWFSIIDGFLILLAIVTALVRGKRWAFDESLTPELIRKRTDRIATFVPVACLGLCLLGLIGLVVAGRSLERETGKMMAVLLGVICVVPILYVGFLSMFSKQKAKKRCEERDTDSTPSSQPSSPRAVIVVEQAADAPQESSARGGVDGRNLDFLAAKQAAEKGFWRSLGFKSEQGRTARNLTAVIGAETEVLKAETERIKTVKTYRKEAGQYKKLPKQERKEVALEHQKVETALAKERLEQMKAMKEMEKLARAEELEQAHKLSRKEKFARAKEEAEAELETKVELMKRILTVRADLEQVARVANPDKTDEDIKDLVDQMLLEVKLPGSQ